MASPLNMVQYEGNYACAPHAAVVELVDTLDSKSDVQ